MQSDPWLKQLLKTWANTTWKDKPVSGIASITQTGKTGSLSINLHCPLVERTQSLLLMLHGTYFFKSCKITLVQKNKQTQKPLETCVKKNSLNVIIKMLFFPDYTESVKINRGVFTKQKTR